MFNSLIYRPDIYKLYIKTVPFPDNQKLPKE